MKRWLAWLLLLPLNSAVLHAACLPTLGTQHCARAWDPQAQAIEHKYFDARIRNVHSRRARMSGHLATDK